MYVGACTLLYYLSTLSEREEEALSLRLAGSSPMVDTIGDPPTTHRRAISVNPFSLVSATAYRAYAGILRHQ